MIKTAIILAGGFGTRLQSVVSEVPKPMAPVAGHPFLEFLLAYAQRQGIEKAVLCVGYKYEVIEAHFGKEFKGMTIEYAIEKEPLGTGGAIWNALQYCNDEVVAVINGDSLFEVDMQALYDQKDQKKAEMVLSLKPMQQFDRYGVVEINEHQRILNFKEKTYCEVGLINGGVYCFDTQWANGLGLSGRFSFEKAVLEEFVSTQAFYGYISDAYFIDIGIPEDYAQSQITFKEKAQLAELKKIVGIDQNWTLFLDRDGVINRRLKNDYVKRWAEFQFMEGVLEVMPQLAKTFGRIIVVTNQQGIGKGLMKQDQLDEIHAQMKQSVEKLGGRIDLILACPDLSAKVPNCRKPNPDMAHWAKEKFPEIDFHRSIMVGDSITDIQFGENLGMKTVWVRGKEDEYHRLRKLDGQLRIDYRLKSLSQLTQILPL